ncbi:hypothetical protein ST47_g8567 [Ascochyta rabiei]|uniref:Uncharacterized protein n=2 Tax=Didymella rabiei TaxID=5454 RepID=A0A162YV17_DIDRA|nr:hypothetical protein ST47_g8567 [Ascochyta rabiei]
MPTTANSASDADYFSHKPRSFLPRHTDRDEKLAAPTSSLETQHRGRRPWRLLGYCTPAQTPALHDSAISSSMLSSVCAGIGGPRVPRTRTLVRLLALGALAFFATLGWRCEAVGCKGRAGGALVGEFVGGGSVVDGWDRGRWSSWGGESVDGVAAVFASAGEGQDEEGEGETENGELVEWDDEEGGFGNEDVSDWDKVEDEDEDEDEDEVEYEDEVEDEVEDKVEDKNQDKVKDESKLKTENVQPEDVQPDPVPQPQNSPQPPTPTGPVGELTGPIPSAAPATTAQAAAAAAATAAQEALPEEATKPEEAKPGNTSDAHDDSSPDTATPPRDDVSTSDDRAAGVGAPSPSWARIVDLGLW